MHDRLSENGIRYVRTHDAARLLGLSARTLEKYRCHGITDLDAWADHSACRSTSDPRYAEARNAGRQGTPERFDAGAHPHR